MQRNSIASSAFFNSRALIALVVFASACSILTGALLAHFRTEPPGQASQRTLTFAERVAYQRAIEDVYWRHRIWPKERPEPKPPLDVVMSQAQLENKVADYLRKSQALEDYWQRPLTPEQLQTEMDRMAEHTKQPDVLRELFAALGNDPFVIAECLARPALADRLLTSWYAHDERIHGDLREQAEAELATRNTLGQMKQLSGAHSEIELIKGGRKETLRQAPRLPNGQLAGGAPALQGRDSMRTMKLNGRQWDETLYKLAAKLSDRLVADAVSAATEAQIKTGVPSPLQENETDYYVTAVTDKTDDRLKVATVSWHKQALESWLAGAESQVPTGMAVPTASYTLPRISEGGCVDDTWTAIAGPPDRRVSHTSVWTGSEMIIWGGQSGFSSYLNSGAKYNPSTDHWTAMTATGAPTPRTYHTAVWTGSEVIIWGGIGETLNHLNTGGRYNPATDNWTATSITNAPTGRNAHTSIWSGNEMIIWGGWDGGNLFNTGGRYNPNTNSWIATSTNNAPTARTNHTAVWTGSEMIIWGGNDSGALNTGGRYNPGTNTWIATSTNNAPTGHYAHTAVWTGGEMIVWGGIDNNGSYSNTGGRYNSGSNSWMLTSTIGAPTGREYHTAVWTGSKMIVWGGFDASFNHLNTGSRYDPVANTWEPTSMTNVPDGRSAHAAVWTGNEVIVWGGGGASGPLNTGGRYDPSTDSWVNTGDDNAPSSRVYHTAIWTGDEMIVWGGLNQDFLTLNVGGRYNPSMDSWTETSTTNAPDPRASHTAVWTGSEMIVWGGFGDVGDFNTGGRYNPGTDNWTATNVSNAPTARVIHTAVWTAVR